MEAVAFAEQSFADFAESHRSGLVENPCRQCRGEGHRYYSSNPGNPDGGEFIDECDECGGSGNGICPGCDDLSCFLVAGDGRCAGCVGEAAVELVEAAEEAEWLSNEAARADAEWDSRDDGRSAEPSYDDGWVAEFNRGQWVAA